MMLRPEHMIIYLCEHALRVGHSFDRLILVCDIFFSIKAFEKLIDWDFIVEESRRIRGSSYFIYLAMNRGLFAKLGFITRTFFPPAQILLQRQYRKDAEFSNSLYLLRIGEIFSHILGLLAPGRTKTPENS